MESDTSKTYEGYHGDPASSGIVFISPYVVDETLGKKKNVLLVEDTDVNPSPGFEAIRDHIAFYPGKMEACLVDGERARPQPGGFYGGWITDDVVL